MQSNLKFPPYGTQAYFRKSNGFGVLVWWIFVKDSAFMGLKWGLWAFLWLILQIL
jgi:hypothetical protein